MAEVFVSPPNLSDPTSLASIEKSRVSPELYGAGYAAKIDVDTQQAETSNQVFNNYYRQQQPVKADPLYAAQAKANASLELQQVFQKSSSMVKEGGNLGFDIGKAHDEISRKYIQSAPNDATARSLQTHFITSHGAAVRWGVKTQVDYNHNSYLNKFDTTAKQQSITVQQDPNTAESVNQQLSEYADALKQSGVSAKEVDKRLQVAQTGIIHTSLLATADKYPAQILNQINSAQLTEKVDGKFLNMLKSRATSSMNSQIGMIDKSLDELRGTALNGVGIPNDAQERLQLADKTVGFLKENGDLLPLKQQELLEKRAEVGTLIQLSQEVQGKTVAELEQIRLNMAVQAADVAGNKSMVAVKKDLNTLIDTRIKSLNDNPYQVELTDGTMARPTIPLSTELNNNPAALEKFIMERRGIAQALTSKYGSGAASLPFSDGELKAIINKTKDLSPSQKLQQLQFLSQLGPDTLGALASKFAQGAGNEAFPMAVGLSAYDVETAAKIAKGSEYLSGEGGAKLAATLDLNKLTPVVADHFGSLFDNDPATVKKFAQAAQAAAAHDIVTGKSTDMEGSFRTELEKISGVQKVSHGWFSGSYNTITPFKRSVDEAGRDTYTRMSGSEFSEAINTIKSSDTLTKYGNGTPIFPLDTVGLDPSETGNTDLTKYKWLPVQDGLYTLVDTRGGTETAAVRDSDGAPYLFNMKHYLKDLHG